ncbi:MAG: hypothetical protein RL700_127 [Pseudomonadota bacterium]|jgi:hypothetical protein
MGMDKTQNPLDKFKHSLDQQGFISPMLTTLAPHEKLKRHSGHQEICGVVLDGELKLVTEAQNTTYTKHDIFFIDGSGSFEIHCGSNGAQYLFSFKNSPAKAC